MKRVHISFRLTASTGVLVGSTAEVLSIGLDKSTIRRRRYAEKGKNQEPLIPATTVKGKIRNEYERILAGLGREVCCAPRADRMCPHDPGVKNPPCAVCQLFGGPNQQARLFFSDATVQADEDLAPFLTRVQAGVSLSRKRRTAEDEKLYQMERGIEGLVYRGEIDCSLEDETMTQQLALVIAALESLVAVGGSKSRGAGWTKAEVESVTIDGLELTDETRAEIRAKGLEQWRESK